MSETAAPMLEVRDLSVVYRQHRTTHTALDGVSLSVRRGETVGLIGESGSGKTTLSRAILGLVPATSGQILFQGEDIATGGRRRHKKYAGDIRVVFQDPYSSLNPALPVATSLMEGLDSLGVSKAEARTRMQDLLNNVGLPLGTAAGYPRTLSGGQRQRLAIGRALMTKPKLLICDEPVSALDVSVQAQVLNLLRDVQRESNIGCLFIGHDLDVVRYMSDRIVVLYHGKIVEEGPAEQIAKSPQHPYTQALMAATPKVGSGQPSRVAPATSAPERRLQSRIDPVITHQPRDPAPTP